MNSAWPLPEKVVLVDGFAAGTEYFASTIMDWNANNPPVVRVADWSVADAGFGPNLVRYNFRNREGAVYFYSCKRTEFL